MTVGGVDIAGCEMTLWRRSVAWVPQRPTVFRGTVADNIRLGRPSAPTRAVREAAELAGADAFIRKLPTGTRPRSAKAGGPSPPASGSASPSRVHSSRAPLVVLDEPTANVDAATAATIGEAIAGLRGERTVLLIAHAPTSRGARIESSG